MSKQPPHPDSIPYDSLAEGIMHGPYPNISSSLMAHYVTSRAQYRDEQNVSMPQFTADTESEWQYNQHCKAVKKALVRGSITPAHTIFMYDKVLRPWFIGHRNPGE